MSLRVNPAKWLSVTNAATNGGDFNRADFSQGVTVPKGYYNQFVHLGIESNVNTTHDVWGLANISATVGMWLCLDRVSNPDANRLFFGEPLDAATAYPKMAVQRVDMNGGSSNAYLGFSEVGE